MSIYLNSVTNTMNELSLAEGAKAVNLAKLPNVLQNHIASFLPYQGGIGLLVRVSKTFNRNADQLLRHNDAVVNEILCKYSSRLCKYSHQMNAIPKMLQAWLQ